MCAPPRVQFQAPCEGSWRHHTSRTCEQKVVVGDPLETRNSHFRHLGLAGHRAKSHTLATRPRSLHRGLSLEQAPREFWTQGLQKFWIQALREFWIHVQCVVLEVSLQLFQRPPLCLPSPRRSELFQQPEQSRRCMACDCTLCSECPTEPPTHMPTFSPSLCPTSQPTINPIAKASLPTTSKVSDRQSAVSGIDPTNTEEPTINPTQNPSPPITIPQIARSLNDDANDEQESDDSDNSILNMSIDIRVNLFEFCIATLCILGFFATLIYCFCKSRKSTKISSHNNEVAEVVHSPEGDGIRVKAQHHEMQCVNGTAGRIYHATSMGRSEENPREGGHRITVRDGPKSLTDELSSQGEAGL